MTFTSLLLNAADDSTLQTILQIVEKIEEDTNSSFMSGDFYFFTVLSVIISFIGLSAIYHELQEDKIKEKCQINLLHDIVRHLYRNKICTVAMRAKYNAMIADGGEGYPSEEHYRKLQLLPDDIHLERYNQNPEIYDKLHELELLLRNYNVEIEVAERHMLDSRIDYETEQRDFDTLDFKTGYLTAKIAGVLLLIEKGKVDVMSCIREIIKTKAENNIKENPRNKCTWGDRYVTILESLRKGERERDWYFTKIYNSSTKEADEFASLLTQDLLIECGQNTKGEEKIHMIKIKKA